MNISERTVISGIEKTKCSVGHIRNQLNPFGGIKEIHYSYFGKNVQRGDVLLSTKNGDFKASFSCRNGWLESLVF